MTSSKDTLVQCLGLVVFCVVAALTVYYIPSEQYAKQIMNKMMNHSKIKIFLEKIHMENNVILERDTERIKSFNPLCRYELTRNSLKVKHISQFYSSILPSEKYEKIVGHLVDHLTNQTFEQCGKIEMNYGKVAFKMNSDLLKMNNLIIDTNFMQKIEQLSLTQSALCAQRVVESILIQKELFDVSKQHEITTLEKAVNFYGQLWIRKDCSHSISDSNKASDLLREYSNQVNEQDVEKLYRLLDIEPSNNQQPLEPKLTKSIFQEQEKKLVNNQIESMKKQIDDLNNTIVLLEKKNQLLNKSISDKERECKQSVDNIQSETDKVQILLREKQVSISSLESKSKSLTAEVQDYQHSVSKIKEELEKEFEKHKVVNQKNIKLEDDNNKLRQKNTDLENEIKKKIPALEEDIEFLKNEKTVMDKQIQQLKNTTYTDLLSGREKLFKQAELLEQSGQNIATIGALLNQFNETLKGDESLREKIGLLLDNLEKKQTSQKHVEDIMSKSKHLEVEGKECFGALSVCREEKSKLINDKQVEKLVLKVSSLEMKIETLNQEKQELVSKVGDYSNTISEIEKKKNEAIERSENLSTILVDLKLEHVEEQKKNKLIIETLEQSLNETKLLLNQSSTQHSTELVQFEKLQRELSNINEKYLNCQSMSETLSEQNGNLSSELDEIKKELVVAQSAKIVSDLNEDEHNTNEASEISSLSN